jgi:hypothetical protein
MLTRKTQIQVFYNGADISADISADLISFTFTDNAGDKSDDISITLQDKDKLWRNEWFPDKGATLRAVIQSSDQPALPCGTFEIDKIKSNIRPSEVEIGAVSVPVSKPIRTEKKTRTWEGADLQKIGQEVAHAAGVEFAWFGSQLPTYNRIDQRDESDLTFLSRLAREVNYKVKLTDGRLVVWDDSEQSKQRASFSVDVEDETIVLSANFESEASTTYKACRLRYNDPVKKLLIDYTARAEGIVSGETLELNRRVENLDQAKTIAERELIRANKFEVTGNVTMMGQSSASAGLVVAIRNAGKYDGNYMIDTARHSYSDSSGWVVSIDIHRVTNE